MSDYLIVLVTAPGNDEAATMASALVQERLAACVNILPGVRSFYRWEGKVQDDPEVMMVIKTRRTLISKLEAHIKELHPYDVPEFVAMDIAHGSAEYLGWLAASTQEG